MTLIQFEAKWARRFKHSVNISEFEHDLDALLEATRRDAVTEYREGVRTEFVRRQKAGDFK